MGIILFMTTKACVAVEKKLFGLFQHKFSLFFWFKFQKTANFSRATTFGILQVLVSRGQ
jgi:hypothetical protein